MATRTTKKAAPATAKPMSTIRRPASFPVETVFQGVAKPAPRTRASRAAMLQAENDQLKQQIAAKEHLELNQHSIPAYKSKELVRFGELFRGEYDVVEITHTLQRGETLFHDAAEAYTNVIEVCGGGGARELIRAVLNFIVPQKIIPTLRITENLSLQNVKSVIWYEAVPEDSDEDSSDSDLDLPNHIDDVRTHTPVRVTVVAIVQRPDFFREESKATN